MTNYDTIYAIIDTETNQFVAVNHKAAWTKVGNAKNAWNRVNSYTAKCSFNEQSRYIVIALERECYS